MSDVTKDVEAHVPADLLAGLQRRLAIAKDIAASGIHLGAHEKSTAEARETRARLDAAAEEILEYAKTPLPIRIHAHAESLPLFKLCQAKNVQPPPELTVAAEQGYRFDIVQVIFSVLLPTHQFPASAGLQLNLADNVNDNTRSTRPVRLFPGTQHQDLFRVDLEGGIGIDSHVDLTVPREGQQIIPYGTLTAKADGDFKAKFVFGPVSYKFRKAIVEVRGESDPFIEWRYNYGYELKDTNEYKHILILKIPKEATRVSMAAVAQVVPCKREWWTLWLVTRALPEKATDPQTLEIELGPA
jgi:hypothetical protein